MLSKSRTLPYTNPAYYLVAIVKLSDCRIAQRLHFLRDCFRKILNGLSVLIVFELVIVSTAISQELEDPTTPYRPKIAEFGIETLMDYGTTSTSESFGDAQNEIERDRLIKAKLGIPLIIKDDRMFGVQLKYYQHRFIFDLEDYPTDYDLFLHMNSKKFTSTGIRTFYQQDFTESQQLRLIAGAELKSDQIKWNSHTAKYFISGIYTWKSSATNKIGTGFVLNRVLDRTTFYPLLIYEKKMSAHWTLDLSLPKSVAIRRRFNNANYLTVTTELKGWRYNLTNAIREDQRDHTLNKADLQLSLKWEHEIHDWLWLGIDVGYTKNLRYHLVNPGGRSRDALINIKSRNATYTKFSIFIVPPGRFYQ